MRSSKPLTAERLEKSALAYLERFATSRENLRRVLRRKLVRAAEEDRAALSQRIDDLIEQFTAAGYLNDDAYAEGRVAALRRQGVSGRGIALKLRAKGVSRESIDEKLATEDGDDLSAAWAYARRRRLGPYRPETTRRDFRQKDMAAMGRAGFDYATARAVIDGEVDQAENPSIKPSTYRVGAPGTSSPDPPRRNRRGCCGRRSG
jgi:regulatory protein